MKFCSTCKEEFHNRCSFCPVDGSPLQIRGSGPSVGDFQPSQTPRVYAGTLQLTGPQQRRLTEALLDAFDPLRFSLLLFHRLNKRVQNITTINAPFEVAVAEVIDRANSEGWLAELIFHAHQAIPGNPKLLGFMKDFRLPIVSHAQEHYALC